jgi:two-component system, NtrC family, sensor histidine kinase HydH
MEEEMLTTVANQAAVCIENSGLTETLNIDEIVRLVLEGVVKNIGFDRARLYMVNEKRNLLECKTAVGLDEEQIREVVLPFDPEVSIVARAIIEKKPYVIPDAMQDPRVNPVMKSRFNLHTLVVIPLLAREKALGAIAVDHAEPGRTVTPEALEAMMAFAQEAGLAIQNASMYQELKAFSQQMEERVQKTTAELKKAEAQLIRSEKLAALGQLAAGVAHEIRNPLTSINILIHSIAESLPRDNTHREDLGVIEEEISRINLIVDQFLKFGKPAPPLLAETEVAPLFEETLQLFKAQIERQRITVVRDFPSLPKVVVDREQMKQVILNLLLNAVQAMPAGGRLGLTGRVAEDRREIEVAICNSGPGIPPEHMGKLFDPFFSTKEGGVGLGLPIAHRIVEQHQGKIEVESTPDVGTCFTVGLPIPARKAKDADHSDRR